MKKIYCLLLMVLGLTYAHAQSAEEANVIAAINQLFKGMYLSDTTMVRGVLRSDLTVATVFRNKEGNPMISREGTADDFVKSISVKREDPLTEEIWNVKVQVDGDFAQGWCDYAFYIGNKFSHCGVDAFQLFKTSEGWKMFHIADTRRKTNCNIPKAIEDKHK